MMHSTPTARDTDAVLAAARSLVDAFARHDTNTYFAAFAPEASFIFHSTPTVLPNRAAYAHLWAEWERKQDFRVRGCISTDAKVQLLGDVAVFHHQVQTTVDTHDGELVLMERETIVFQRTPQDTWLAVHEHLSALPL